MIIVIFILFALAWWCDGAGQKSTNRISAERLARASFAFTFCGAVLTIFELIK